MRRVITTVVAVALSAVACGGGESAPASTVLTSEAAAETTAVSQITEAPATTEAASPSTEPATTTPAATTPPPDGPPAPDFTLALGEGGSFTLSEAQNPVYMVFWAEW